MSNAIVSSPFGFNTNDFWVANTGQSSNETFVGLTSSTGTALSSQQTATYSEFDFIHNGLLYRYLGSWTVSVDRDLLSGTIQASGSYNQIIVESLGVTVATYSGPTEVVNFGSFAGGGVLNLVGGLVGGVVDLLLGGANGSASFANLHLDATPTLPAKAYADGATLSGGLGGDALTGGASADLLIGAGGNDVLDGAGGIDTAVFSQARSAYTITQSTVNGVVTTTVSNGTDGIDTLVNIENLRFGGVNGTTMTLAQSLDTTAPVVTVANAGGLTNQATHVITGTVGIADAGTVVGIYEGAALLGSGTVQPNGTWSATITLTGEGAHTLVARDTDASGNTGSSSPINFVLDTIADDGAPTTVTVNDTADHLINAIEAQAVSFTVAGLDPGASAAITFTDAQQHSVVATAAMDGVYAVNLSSLNGAVTSSVLVTDPAGNTVSTTGNTVLVDTTPIIPDTTAPVVAVTSTGGLTNQTTQVITGTVGVADAGTVVGIYEGSTLLGTGVVQPNGTWSATVTLNGDGTHTLIARDTDLAGNTGSSSPINFVLDTVADEGTPTSLTVNDTADHIINATEAQAVGFTVAGLDPGASAAITFTDLLQHTVQATAAANGTYAVDLSGLDGLVTSSVVVTDAAGNTVTRVGNAVLVDTTLVITDPTTPVVTVTSTGGLTNQTTQVISGTVGLADVGTTVGIYEGSTLLGGGIVQPDGTWSATVTLSGDGVHTLVARDTNSSGTTGSSSPINFVLDTIADDGAPTTVTVNDTADHVITAVEASAVGFTVAGLDLGASAVITFTDAQQHTAQATALANGTYAVDLSGLNGNVTSSVLVTDLAGNTVTRAGNTVLLDTTPVVPDITPPVVTVANPGGLTNQTTHVISGTVGLADAGTTVGIYEGATLLGAGVVQPNGTWTATVTLNGDGVHTLIARDTDAAGNTGSSSPINFVLDTIADDGAPTTITVNDTADHIIDATEARAVGFTIAGLDPGSTAGVTFSDGQHSVQATAAANGTYAVDLSGLNGNVTSSVLVTDPAGNTVTRTGNIIHLDTTPTVPDTAPPLVTVTSEDGLTNQPTQVITGTVGVEDAGTTVGIYEGATLLGTGVVQPNGTWSATVTLNGDGTHTLVARDTDAAGNTGSSSPIKFVLDTVADEGAPTTVTVNDTADHVIDANEAHAVNFTVAGLDPGATAGVTFSDGQQIVQMTAGANGTFAVDLSGLNGNVTSSVLVTDPAGNTVTTAGNVVHLDTQPSGGTVTTPGTVGALHDVYRFYDTVTNDHFYTTDPNEAASIKANLPTFNYEGVPWQTPDKGADTLDVFRFYDTVTKTHFLTTSTAERDMILKELPTFTYEGVAFQAYAQADESGEFALERFYNTNSKVHTYAADANEAALIKSGAVGQGWVDEGPSFVVHHPTNTALHA